MRTFGEYSAFRACKAIVFKSSLHSRLTVATIFLHLKRTSFSCQHGSHHTHVKVCVLTPCVCRRVKLVGEGKEEGGRREEG